MLNQDKLWHKWHSSPAVWNLSVRLLPKQWLEAVFALAIAKHLLLPKVNVSEEETSCPSISLCTRFYLRSLRVGRIAPLKGKFDLRDLAEAPRWVESSNLKQRHNLIVSSMRRVATKPRSYCAKAKSSFRCKVRVQVYLTQTSTCQIDNWKKPRTPVWATFDLHTHHPV